MNQNKKISKLDIVIPCHNEEETIQSTYSRLSALLQGFSDKGLIEAYSLIFVDNGSTDRTLLYLENLFQKDPNIVIISLRRNFGFQGSISAGLAHVSGDVAVTIDADLQDPPEKIEEMIQKYQEGFELVLGVRKSRKSDSFLKKTTAALYYKLLKSLGVPIIPQHGDFRLMSRKLVDIFNELPERNRFIRAMVLQLDAKFTTVCYARKPRTSGYSKFNFGALLSLGLDGITSFSYVPLRIAAFCGFIFSCLSFFGVIYVIHKKLVYHIIPGWASTVVPLLFFSGIQLLFLGIIGEYIGKIYAEIKKRPIFLVRKKYEHETDSADAVISLKTILK